MTSADVPAVEALAFISKKAGIEEAEEVVGLLLHKDGTVREAAAEALADLEDPRAAEAVARLATDQDADVRVQAVEVLTQMGETGSLHAEALTSLLEDTEPQVRAAAVEAMAKMQQEAAADRLAHLLKDEDGCVRASVALALASLGHPDSVAILLDDADSQVQVAAVEALGQAGAAAGHHAGAVAALASHEDAHVRGAVAKALAAMGPAGAGHMAAVAGLLADRSAYASRHAAQALAQMGEAKAARTRDLPREIKTQTAWARLLDTAPCVPKMRRIGAHEVWLVEDLFSKQECAALIAAAEGRGFGATDYAKEYRGNLRLITMDGSLAHSVWGRLQPLVPSALNHRHQQWTACGLNDCWRLSKYHPHDRFERHVDTCFLRTYDERSMLTVNIYLNEGFEGGSTRFYFNSHGSADFNVAPKAGLCLLFRQPPDHHYDHDGEEVGSGIKYLLRSDVMYQRKG
mmetsp:Transcript_115918/g.322774  ORF Transcript_115918/g.322774 Transcript_115918/m.322774 type:complete len:460 (+) Transcript_115918:66-1445(+)|eukprot:CAMPEP_0179067556 /NCGR_PEP_ID=MMETSP0796-20121207/29548_1 /TAXON_ID=73915 /ORGANISM="Pyrodinium bahamense, Strain pbaha01" /LENGTH=459 /DNA_ID=CAMNT_0020764585 /DNA_START=64 /DNA_END=1443 /DNA_ORIENTATION=-